MALYTFLLDGFHIDNTRSRHEDTIIVGFAVRLEGSTALIQTKFCGDVNNGDHPVVLVSPPLFVAKDASFAVVSNLLYNGGDPAHPKIDVSAVVASVIDGYVKAVLERGGPVPIPDQPNLPTSATFDDPEWIKILEFAAIASFFFPDCDGVVAADAIGWTKVQLDTAIDAAGGSSYRQRRRYPGTDSPAGCGSNSDYTVTWSVTRERESGAGPHSLRQFLAKRRLTASPGLRSLASAGQPLSVKDLMT